MTSDPESKRPYHLSEFGVETGRHEETLWPIRQYTVSVSLGSPTAESQRLHDLMNETYTAVREDMNRAMYGDYEIDGQYKLKRSRFSIIRQRIADAWSVLLGREHIGGDY